MMALGFIFAGLLVVALVGLGAKASSSTAAVTSPADTAAASGSGTAANVKTSVPGISAADANQAIADAISQYNVPADVFYGMFSKETTLGANIATSSAGAVGPFQFEPATAGSYNYPLTNTPTLQDFQAQANAAAHYLSDLYHQTGSWLHALAAYNAGPGNIPAGLGYAADALSLGQALVGTGV
jgi:soluble lytic murein transglycosylase-like protein